MGKRAIVKNSGLLVLPSVVRFLLGLARAKIVAVFLGTLGSGVMSQLQSLLNSISSFTTSGMPDGMVKQLAQANSIAKSKTSIASIIKTYSVLVLSITLIVYTVGFIFSKELTQFVFGDLKYLKYFHIGFAALPVMILSSSSYAIIKAYKSIKSLMWADLIIALSSFILFVGLVVLFKLTGAIIYIVLTFFISAVTYRKIANDILRKEGLSLSDIYKAEFLNSNFKELMSFTGVFLISGVFEIFVNLYTRSILVNSHGINSVVIYAPIIAWAGLFMGFILPSITTYLYPRFCEAKTNDELGQLLNDIIRLLCFITIPFVLFGITFRGYLIPLFYSKEFESARIFLPFHFVALYFTIFNYSFAQVFAPTGRLKQFIPLIIFNNILTVVLVYFLVPKYGLWGWVAKFSIVPVVSTILYYIYWKITINFSFSKTNWYLFLLIILSSALLLLFRDKLIMSALLAIITLTGSWFLMQSSEKKFLLNIFLFRNNKPII